MRIGTATLRFRLASGSNASSGGAPGGGTPGDTGHVTLTGLSTLDRGPAPVMTVALPTCEATGHAFVESWRWVQRCAAGIAAGSRTTPSGSVTSMSRALAVGPSAPVASGAPVKLKLSVMSGLPAACVSRAADAGAVNVVVAPQSPSVGARPEV